MAARPARAKNRHIGQLFSKEAVRKVLSPSRVVGCYSVRRILPPTDPWPGNMRLMRTSSSRFWPCVVQLKSDVSTQIELAGNLEAKLSQGSSLSSVLITLEGHLDFARRTPKSLWLNARHKAARLTVQNGLMTMPEAGGRARSRGRMVIHPASLTTA